VELDRVVPPSGNLWVAGQQIWLGPAMTGRTVRLHAGLDRVHVLLDGYRIKTLPSRLDARDLARLAASGASPAGPPPLPPASGEVIEVERMVNASGNVSLGGHIISAGLPLAGQRVTLRLDGPVAHILSGGILARTVACPVPEQARVRLRGGRAATAHPPRLPDYQLFWIIRNGVRYSGMSAYDRQWDNDRVKSDDQIWKAALFLSRLDALPPAVDAAWRVLQCAVHAELHRALEAGARGYVIKGMPYQTLIDALLRVHSGGRFLPPPVARALAARMPDSDLSSREQEVLRHLVDGMTNKEIATLLGITEATVKCHVSTILMRLNVSDRTQAVVTALQRGLVHL
jgi:DNA-binding CsgD family transcriptional regulator